MNGQVDIFLDGLPDVAIDDLIKLLIDEDIDSARQHLERNREKIDDVKRHFALDLIEALETPPPENTQKGMEMMKRMEEAWCQAAQGLLGIQSHDFLLPFWKKIGKAIEGLEFVPDHPNDHASWAYLQAHDWNNVVNTIRDVPKYDQHSTLLLRLADAYYRLHHRTAAIETWFALCFIDPEKFEEHIENKIFPDRSLKQSWVLCQDQDMEPELTAEWFPTWMLIEEPGLATTLKNHPLRSRPSRGFNLLLSLHKADSEEHKLTLRKELKSIHPGLLKRYLFRLDTLPQKFG